ncbi:MAG: efflux RND transporter periplasmic adaptor subunit [Micavibrio sp.]|nr:efflux RND transporter periplasmic adaptor subunit [Micavibrio sp.]
MKSYKILAIIIALLALAWIVSGVIAPNDTVQTPPPAEQSEEKEDKLQKVRVRDLKSETYRDTVKVTGRTQANREVVMKAEIAGQISTVLLQEGESVQEGDILAELDVRDRQLREDEARQRLEQRRIEYNAAKKLAEKGFSSKVKLAQSTAEYESAKAALKQAALDIENMNISAPFDGIVSKQVVESGDYVSVGENLFTIVDLDPIELVGYVSERNVKDLEIGQIASATLLGGEKIDATISYISPASDDQTRTFRVILSAPNSDFAIKDGLTANLEIPTKDKTAFKITPSILTLDDEGRIGVKIVGAGDKVKFVPVKILNDAPDYMWVSGPPENARFITVGQEYVIDDQVVEPVLVEGDGLL